MSARNQTAYQFWCFTLNNPDRADLTLEASGDYFLAEFTEAFPDVQFLEFQREVGEAGTPHYQGYVEFTKRKRLSQLHSFDPRIHWETRKGTQQQALAYVRKADTASGERWSFGDPLQKSQGKRTDLQRAIEIGKEGGIQAIKEQLPTSFVMYNRGLRDLFREQPRQTGVAPEVVLLFGPPDCGKTRTFYELEPRGVALPSTDGYWFDGYDGHPAVLVDDFAGRSSHWTLPNTLRILDRYVINVPVKGGFVVWKPKRLYVTSNIHPLAWYDWSERQVQYPALKRRFTLLKWFRGNGRYDIVEPTDTVLWERFWAGRDAHQLMLDTASGKLVSRAPTTDYYDF